MTIQNYAITVRTKDGKQQYTTAATSTTAAILFVMHTYGYCLESVCKCRPLVIK